MREPCTVESEILGSPDINPLFAVIRQTVFGKLPEELVGFLESSVGSYERTESESGVHTYFRFGVYCHLWFAEADLDIIHGEVVAGSFNFVIEDRES